MSVNEANISELELLRQRIRELEAENAEIPDLRKKLAEIPELRKKLAEVEVKNAELIKQIMEENNRRDAKIEDTNDRVAKLEQLQNDNTPNDNTPNNNSSNFNSGAVYHEKPLDEKEMDNFLLEAHKKIVGADIRRRNKEKKLQAQESLPTHPEEKISQDLTQPCNSTSSEEKICSELDSKCKKGKGVNKLKQELFASELPSQVPIVQNHVTKISETAGPRKSSIDEALQHLAQLCDKAFDAEDGANRANQEEILCWCLYAKDFRTQLNEIIENSDGKFGEKKARSLLYNSITKHLNLLRKQRSQELGLHLPEISRDALRKKTQRAEKIYTLFEEIGLGKIKLIKTYSANSISKLTNGQIREIIEEQIDSPANTFQDISSEKIPEVLQSVSNHVTEISETAGPRKNFPEVNTPSTSQITPAKANDNDLTDLKDEDFCGGERM
ncbi:hypothetical protein RhiirA5_437761 [Rhizophagus irregularis]|uniref:Uncharacterized protein n=1 Tax=Rhizophagus irregularis TaxID=588596 RepID=A0A2N0NK23_9GLOM|nr:hypothetical protein RhiirA5_437761 [Rhizophagus irregularis]